MAAWLAVAGAAVGWTACAPAAASTQREIRIGDIIAGSPVWAEWSRRYVRPSGRVLDTATGVSHSEGQAYGMLLAVAAGDRAAFDRIWNWTRSNLAVRADRLLAWRWDPATRAVADRNNATDGDILAAWALAEAADLWSAPEYLTAASDMAADIGRLLVVDAVGVGPVLLPASFGFTRADQGDGPVVNLSYWIFPAFGRLAQAAPGVDWDGIRRSGLSVIDAIQGQTRASITNWTALADNKAAPARRFPARVGYDAVRIPLYLAFAPRENMERLAKFDAMFPAGSPGFPVVDARTGEVEEVAPGRGYRAIAALRACAIGGQPFPRDFYWLGENESYYPATLHLLSMIAALASHRDCLDPVETHRLQPQGWSRRMIGDLTRLQPQRVAVQPAQVARPVVASPAAHSASDEDDSAARLLRVSVPIGAILALVGFIAVSRRSTTPAFVQDPAPSTLRERSPAPRHLPDNPFHAARGERALEERLDIAAKASWDWQRTAAVAYFRLCDYATIAEAEGPGAAQRAVNGIVAALSTRIRKSDAVTVIAPNEVIVCLSLIADDVDLASVGRRLTLALRDARPALGADENLFGLALYGRDQTGAQCLTDARAAFEAMRPPPVVEEAPPAKPRRRRARAKAAPKVET
ncbi:MAG: glycosyl hydrolase family 8 [Rhodoblastus sp.]